MLIPKVLAPIWRLCPKPSGDPRQDHLAVVRAERDADGCPWVIVTDGIAMVAATWQEATGSASRDDTATQRAGFVADIPVQLWRVAFAASPVRDSGVEPNARYLHLDESAEAVRISVYDHAGECRALVRQPPPTGRAFPKSWRDLLRESAAGTPVALAYGVAPLTRLLDVLGRIGVQRIEFTCPRTSSGITHLTAFTADGHGDVHGLRLHVLLMAMDTVSGCTYC